MSTYTAPRRTPSKRSLSRRFKILLAASLLAPVSLLAIAITPASAATKFATLQDVQDAIDTALAPINSAIASLQQGQTSQQNAITDLQSTQTTHTSQISDLQTHQASQDQAIQNLQAKKAQPISIFSGSLSNGQYSNVFDTNGDSILFLTAKWDSGQGGYNIFYSDDQQSWTEQADGISSFVADGNVPPQSTALVLKARYYKFSVVNSFSGQLTGILY